MIFKVQMTPIQNKFLELFFVSVQLKFISESGLEFFMGSIFIWLSICFIFNLWLTRISRYTWTCCYQMEKIFWLTSWHWYPPFPGSCSFARVEPYLLFVSQIDSYRNTLRLIILTLLTSFAERGSIFLPVLCQVFTYDGCCQQHGMILSF